MLYFCVLTLHDNVFFATREMGTLYETEKYLHNWALSYALFEGDYINRPYRLKGESAQKPSYLDPTHEQSLHPLNEAGLYVLPAMPMRWSYQVNTFKAAQVNYYGKSKQFGDKGADRNYPINFGRAKELAVGSIYHTFLVAANAQSLPQWIRLGKWAAKVRVEVVPIPDAAIQSRSSQYQCHHPLNPLDLPVSTQLQLYNRVVMPPVSLVSQAQLSGDYWQISKPDLIESDFTDHPILHHLPTQVCLPRGSFYGANTVAA